MKILSFGAGAIGTFIGGSLALAGHKVVFVEQAQAADLLHLTGLKLNLALDQRRQGQAEYKLFPQRLSGGSLPEAFYLTDPLM